MTSTDRTADPTHISHNRKDHTHETLDRPEDHPKCSGVAVLWRLCRCDRSFLKSLLRTIPREIFLFLRFSR